MLTDPTFSARSAVKAHPQQVQETENRKDSEKENVEEKGKREETKKINDGLVQSAELQDIGEPSGMF